MSPLNALPFSTKGQRIGLLGGSFNPPHQGHVELSLLALKSLELDAVWWLVTPGNPLKSHAELKPLATRALLCEKITHHPKIKITTAEETFKTRFTIDSLRRMKRIKPQIEFFWLMGADNLSQFHKWKKWQEILSETRIFVANRPNYGLKALHSPAARKLNGQFFYNPTLNNTLSSTQLRKQEDLIEKDKKA